MLERNAAVAKSCDIFIDAGTAVDQCRGDVCCLTAESLLVRFNLHIFAACSPPGLCLRIYRALSRELWYF